MNRYLIRCAVRSADPDFPNRWGLIVEDMFVDALTRAEAVPLAEVKFAETVNALPRHQRPAIDARAMRKPADRLFLHVNSGLIGGIDRCHTSSYVM